MGFVFFLITIAYGAANMFQGYRNYYAIHLWEELYPNGFSPWIYTEAELISGVIALSMYAGIFFIKRERWAFYAVIGLMLFGCLWMFIPTICYRYSGKYSGVAWNYLVGVGIYLAYVPPGAIIYDKFMSVINANVTAVYPIYITGTFGSICSLVILIIAPIYFNNNYVYFFELLSYITAGVVFVSMGLSLLVFYNTINRSL